MKRPVLVIMAAGMGSRYGGLKQIDPIDARGHIIIDYSLYDAKAAGFEDVVCIIKKEDEADFMEVIGNRMQKDFHVTFVYQEKVLPAPFTVPEGRVKPFGTGHAILSCKEAVCGPFAVINADDYYGAQAFAVIYRYLARAADAEDAAKGRGKYRYAMVGYEIENTLTDNGHVARGVCVLDKAGHLGEIHERTHIERRDGGAAYTEDGGKSWQRIEPNSIVSMNLWGFTGSIFTELEKRFPKFLKENLEKNPLGCEFFLPDVVEQLLAEDRAVVEVLRSPDRWYGVTYHEDKQTVVDAFAALRAAGRYPEELLDASSDVKARNADGSMPQRLADIVRRFQTEGAPVSITPYGHGHINDTYLVTCQEAGTQVRYILQRMNDEVFTDVDALMENVVGVTTFLAAKIRARGGDVCRETLNVIRTEDGHSYLRHAPGENYRMYLFIEDATSFDAALRPEDFYESGRAFGNFQFLLSDYPAATLHETIPDFHNTKKRYGDFLRVLEADPMGRRKEVQPEADFVKARNKEMSMLTDLLRRGILPLRVTHNDTKLNNIMIDNATGKGICVIDLDTVMPGLSLYDFGDSIRFGASTASEDEPDLTKVSLDLELFERYVSGYIEGCRDTLSASEQEQLPMGAKLMTLECGMRFLTDYLQGDVYFKTERPGQNLDRCRTQFTLVADMEKKWEQMHVIVEKCKESAMHQQ